MSLDIEGHKCCSLLNTVVSVFKIRLPLLGVSSAKKPMPEGVCSVASKSEAKTAGCTVHDNVAQPAEGPIAVPAPRGHVHAWEASGLCLLRSCMRKRHISKSYDHDRPATV